MKFIPFTMSLVTIILVLLPLLVYSSKEHGQISEYVNIKKDQGSQQMLGVLLATAGAIMSIINFENSFKNAHQRLGLTLYGAVWLQALIGILRTKRGSRGRSTWYVSHWAIGTIVSVLGIINVYTGLHAYHRRTSKNISLWNVLFTIQISIIAFLYLFQDKCAYIQKQGVILGHVQPTNHIVAPRDDPKELL